MKETFGEFLKNLRVENEMTLTQLGAKLGIDSGALSKIENNKRKLDEKILPKIAKVFKLNLDKLKDEFISEQIAYKVYENNCTNNVLKLAEEKIEYIKQRNYKQGSLDL
ncbi:MAG: helix-turn-helix transcriptional regulator [Bacteroidales bacterium]|jgi:transcriptional regulator with XRE-family HTH domain|nr:helix-turn-helix transcriptional regulator [Bacteroidales bacterium]MDD4216098.1 helix-turn-helix transcriptional regulator [Bacteroidales bacterium]